MVLCTNFVSQPWVQQLVVAAESDSAATHNWDYGLGFHPLQELIPKRIVQFIDHTDDPDIDASIRLPSFSRTVVILLCHSPLLTRLS
jgi:hypothetical protein